MSTLPLELVLHIVDIGDLDIQDIFSLFQVNKLFRQKLQHPFFWHVFYNKNFQPFFDELEIEKSTDNHFEQCKIYYKYQLELKYRLNNIDNIDSTKDNRLELLQELFNTSKEKIEGYCTNNDYLPVLLKLMDEEEKKFLKSINKSRNDYIVNKKSEYNISLRKASILQYYISNQMNEIGLKHLRHLGRTFTPLIYEKILFCSSLLESSNYRSVRCRKRFIDSKKKALVTKVKPFLFYQLHSQNLPIEKLFSLYLHLSLKIVLNDLSSKTVDNSQNFAEHLDVMKLYNGCGKVYQSVVYAVALKIIYEVWDSFHYGIPSTELTHSTCTKSCLIAEGFAYAIINSKLYSDKVIEDQNIGDTRLNVGLMKMFLYIFKDYHKTPSLRFRQVQNGIKNRDKVDFCYSEPNFIKQICLKPTKVNTIDTYQLDIEINGSPLCKIFETEKPKTSQENFEDRGLVVSTRSNYGVILNEKEEFLHIFTVCGSIETISKENIEPWHFKKDDDIYLFLSLFRLSNLFIHFFQAIQIDYINKTIKFISY
ncbi:hypothetical protein KGF54_005431 [Candida jiufengensis]|uniref:uncharacterized protein n=1 Tax=Candida jiufengensis TaxID=497108 RepID=UPI002224C12B|nr:uncharacterized protein KGF54_005431 [Candida jiufengensis]KAI5949554.1 hypothetical protein KGF54_005431 [Candida jiufengensis]